MKYIYSFLFLQCLILRQTEFLFLLRVDSYCPSQIPLKMLMHSCQPAVMPAAITANMLPHPVDCPPQPTEVKGKKMFHPLRSSTATPIPRIA
jgi:hypothetical protein